MSSKRNRRSKQSGNALITTVGLLFLLAAGTAAYVDRATLEMRIARQQAYDIQTTHLCEAGVQEMLLAFWTPFKVNQNFNNIDSACTGATVSSPLASLSDSIAGVGKFSAGVIGYSAPDTYTRLLTVRCVAYIDLKGTGVLDPSDPQKIVDVVATYQLQRSQVFDYTYFINNYGWMDGFGPNDLIVNGDMRANGDFSITNGTPTINGSLYACANNKLIPPVQGLINQVPLKWDDPTYTTAAASNSRMRQAYNATSMGAKGSAQYEQWRDIVFESNASIVNNSPDGAVAGDSTGLNAWTRTSTGSSGTETLLDSTPTQEVIMPDLSNLSYYENLSQTYVDTKATFQDGSANPNYNQGAYVETWNTTTNSYQTLSTNGVVTGSAALIGSSQHPIIIHGPVTFTQDAVIKGNVTGQGTIYTGRNVHIVGSIIYNNPPNFQGTSQTAIDNHNEKADIIALAARGSVIMGDTSQFGYYPLAFMSPPFTHARLDDYGNLIPAYNATSRDSTGYMLYQSVMGDTFIHSIASGVNQMDCVMYTNFVGGGDIGTSGGGVTINGTIISKDESMVVWSLPMRMNYDSRIKERTLNQSPLINLTLPRSPVMLRSSWQDRGFYYSTVRSQ